MLANVMSLAMLASMVAASPRALEERAACNADNCLRAVRGTRRPGGPAAGLAECTSFFQSTVTPIGYPTVTSTVTSVVTVTAAAVSGNSDLDRRLDARQEKPLPKYVASFCQNPARYASACSCAGAATFASTTLPVATVTATATVTETVAPSTSPSCRSFIVSASDGETPNLYLQGTSGSVQVKQISASEATVYQRADSRLVGTLASPDSVWASFAGSGSPVIFEDASSLPPYQEGTGEFSTSAHGLFCDYPQHEGGALVCQGWFGFGYGQEVYQLCPASSGDSLVVDGVVDTSFDSSCHAITLTAIPACD